MNMKKVFTFLVAGVMATALLAGCGDDKKPAAKAPVKLNLTYEKVKMDGGKELQLAKLSNVNKMSFNKTFHYAGAMTKIGDYVYIRNNNTGNIVQTKLEGSDLKVTKDNFISGVSARSYLSTDGKNLLFADKKNQTCLADATGKISVLNKRYIAGLVGVPGKNEALSFLTAQPITRFALTDGKLGKELGNVIPDKVGRKNLLSVPGGLHCDGTYAYLFGSTLDGKMTVGAVAAYDLTGQQKYVLGNKYDKARKPGFLGSAHDLAVTKDYLYVVDLNLRKINIFTKKDGKFVDMINSDKLFKGQRGVDLVPFVENNVLAFVTPSAKNEPDKIFMLNM